MMEKTGLIELEGMEFHAGHGCLESEKTAGNLFTVDFRGSLDISEPACSDRLGDALDYGKIYRAVDREMRTHSDLLENLAGRIAGRIASEFPELESFSVRVSKRRPPVDGIVQWSRITVFHNKELK